MAHVISDLSKYVICAFMAIYTLECLIGIIRGRKQGRGMYIRQVICMFMVHFLGFAAICLDDNDQPYYITLKLDPVEGDFWRKQYEDIIPGYYMNKQHWNSVKADGEVPDDILKDLLDKAYEIVLRSFSKKKQKEILGEN